MRPVLILLVFAALGCGKQTADIGPDPAKSATRVDRSVDVVVDAPSQLMWTRTPGAAMDWASARTHCRWRVDGDFNDWRLPLRSELEALIDKAVRPADDPTGHLLREPFRSIVPPPGYLFSGDLVPRDDGEHPWVMNLRNAHVFNGHGYRAQVLCVRRP